MRSRPRRSLSALALLATVVLSACSSDERPVVTGGSIPTMLAAGFGDRAPLTVIVSNQSFERPSVRIVVAIDGQAAVDEVFDVGGQHDYRWYSFDVAPGRHDVTIGAGRWRSAVTVDVIGAATPRWVYVAHWEDRVRTETFDTRPGFA